MDDQSVRVVKLGGSLLDLEDLAPRFRGWLAQQPPMQNVILAGGGDMADVIRAAYARHQLTEEDAHWLCVRVLGITAELVARLLPEYVLVRRFDELRQQSGRVGPVIFDCEQFLREVDPHCPPAPLPHTWDVTSDSIAARLAAVLSVAELVLLKSRLPSSRDSLPSSRGPVSPRPEQSSLEETQVRGLPKATSTGFPDTGESGTCGDAVVWAAEGYVDQWFPRIAPGLSRIRVVDFRSV